MKKEILCYGDSNTWGCVPRWKDLGVPSDRYDMDVRWTGRLAALLGPDYHIIEEGLGGRTTIYDFPGEPYRNGLPYLQPCLLSHRPLDLVIIMLGSNDLHACLHPAEERLGDGIRRLVETVQATPKCGRGNTPPPVLVIAPAWIKEALGRREVYPKLGGEAGEALSRRFAGVYRRAAEELGCRFLDAALYAQPSDADGLHWMPDSHRRLADALAEVVPTFFEEGRNEKS
ncbi:MAG: SGNH/GDSL hydrolase family protein [Oscillospiraceae bacterium]|nr:SGNH/GDSL hydrolase family protein [Oscillospiraceae bacterium]